MKHSGRKKRRTKGKLKHIAAAVAGAAIMSSMVLPGIPATVAHAAKNTANQSAHTSHHETRKSESKHHKAPDNYEDVVHVKATAYAPGPHDNDQWGNKTYLGTHVRPGIIAVDPDVIPLGSKVLIQYPDGRSSYAVAEDVGGAIKGNRIDVAKWTVDEANDFGMKDAKVYILEKGDTK